MNYIECSSGHEKDIECETIVSRPAIVAKCRMHINEGNFTGQKIMASPEKNLLVELKLTASLAFATSISDRSIKST